MQDFKTMLGHFSTLYMQGLRAALFRPRINNSPVKSSKFM